mmetsp:Transcript_23416/g.73778  ORF Transcript_23416/g.73778 Transcript_23416/m.73778 type:complete len:131 (-) Transcript_23416:81-473(-)
MLACVVMIVLNVPAFVILEKYRKVKQTEPTWTQREAALLQTKRMKIARVHPADEINAAVNKIALTIAGEKNDSEWLREKFTHMEEEWRTQKECCEHDTTCLWNRSSNDRHDEYTKLAFKPDAQMEAMWDM